MGQADIALQRNIDYFMTRLPSLLSEYLDQYVLIANAQIVEICSTYEAAVTLGYTKFGTDQAFLLQQIKRLPDRVDNHLACQAS